MCGIAGAIGQLDMVTKQLVESMVCALAHRGPDDNGSHIVHDGETAVGLGNTRLAILDLSSAGHQPMVDQDTSNWITYNGEVFNFGDIRRDLESMGVRFHSDTDTEVVLKAYARLGPACVERFRGMFAFAIWDNERRELFLCRDRLGLKPLYYTQARGGLLFASELRALLASGLVERRLDPVSLEAFLANGFVVSPRTMVRSVCSLLPGCWIRVGAHGEILERSRYWKIEAGREAIGRQRFIRETAEQLQEAVRLRMASDVPLGAFLSGGMDSSIIVSLMKQNGGDVRTFAVGFDEAAYDESRYSRSVAAQFGARHTEFRLGRSAFYEMVPDALGAMDQPTFDGINVYCVARAARQSGLTVALSGLGADELFGGYAFFNSARWLARTDIPLRFLPRRLSAGVVGYLQRKGLAALSGPWKTAGLLVAGGNGHAVDFRLAAYQTAQVLFPSWARRAITIPELDRDGMDPVIGLPPEFVDFVAPEIAEETDKANVFSKLALRLFLGERCLRDADSMSMGVSLEVRAPFTDHVLLDNVSAFTGSVRCSGAPNKPLLRCIAKPFLGKEFPYRPKQGFIFPFQEWLPAWGGFREFSNDASKAPFLRECGLDPHTVTNLFKWLSEEPDRMRWSRVWAVYVVTEWLKRHRVRV